MHTKFIENRARARARFREFVMCKPKSTQTENTYFAVSVTDVCNLIALEKRTRERERESVRERMCTKCERECGDLASNAAALRAHYYPTKTNNNRLEIRETRRTRSRCCCNATCEGFFFASFSVISTSLNCVWKLCFGFVSKSLLLSSRSLFNQLLVRWM